MVLWIERSLLGIPCCKREKRKLIIGFWFQEGKRLDLLDTLLQFLGKNHTSQFQWRGTFCQTKKLVPFLPWICLLSSSHRYSIMRLTFRGPVVFFPESEVNTITVSVFAPLLKLGGTYPITNRTQRKTPFSGWTLSRRGCPRCRSRWPWRRWRELWSSRCAAPSCSPRSGWSSSSVSDTAYFRALGLFSNPLGSLFNRVLRPFQRYI